MPDGIPATFGVSIKAKLRTKRFVKQTFDRTLCNIYLRIEPELLGELEEDFGVRRLESSWSTESVIEML